MKQNAKVREFAQFHYLDDLDGLLMLQARYYHQTFSRHIHETFCIGVIEEGAQNFFAAAANMLRPKAISF